MLGTKSAGIGCGVTPLTVIMTHFGCEAFLAEAVGSILDQSFPDLELWLVDDCSPNEQWLEVLDPFRADQRLRLFKADRNVGTYRLKARLIQHIASPLVAFQDSDDISERLRFEQQIEALERRRLDIVGCSYRILDEAGAAVGERRMPRACNWLERLGKKHLVHHPTCVVRANVFDEIGSFDGTTRIGADSDFVLRAVQRFRVGNVRRPLYCYRERRASLTRAPDTGYGSAFRQDYMKSIHDRWRRNRRLGAAADLRPRAIDVDFAICEL